MRSLPAVVILALSLPVAAPAVETTAADPMHDSVQSVRDVGVALWRWYHDEYPAAKIAPAPDLERVDLAAIPVLSLDEVEKLLVPKYLTSLPRTDAWGHPLEVRVHRGERAAGLLAVRSAGADGALEPASYAVGPFEPTDPNSDLVWTDGVFARWPQSPSDGH